MPKRSSRGRRMEKKNRPAKITQPIIFSHASIAPPSEIAPADARLQRRGGQVPYRSACRMIFAGGGHRAYLNERLPRTVAVARTSLADPGTVPDPLAVDHVHARALADARRPRLHRCPLGRP